MIQCNYMKSVKKDYNVPSILHICKIMIVKNFLLLELGQAPRSIFGINSLTVALIHMGKKQNLCFYYKQLTNKYRTS